MRRLTLHAALIGALLVVFGAGSYAVAHGGKRHVKTGDMSGYFEAPSVSSAASGEFEAKIDDSRDTITYELEYEDLEGTVTQAHIHFGQRSVSGGISVWLCETATNQNPLTTADTPTCPQSGKVTGTLTPADVQGPGGVPPAPGGQGIAPGEFEELVAAIRAGRTYANVHSSKFAPGEIRGQINDRNQRDD
jgi:hypothetical protein